MAAPAPIYSSAKLSLPEIATVCRTAGWTGRDLEIAIATVLLESGGVPTRVGVVDPRDLGLFQINKHWHPEVLSIAWQNPQANANLAHEIQVARGWSEWSTYPASALRSQAPDIKAAARGAKDNNNLPNPAAALGRAGGSVLSSAEDAIPGVAEAKATLAIANRVGHWITDPSKLLRIVYVIVGGTMMIGALIVIASRSSAVQTVASVTPAGGVSRVWFGPRADMQ